MKKVKLTVAQSEVVKVLKGKGVSFRVRGGYSPHACIDGAEGHHRLNLPTAHALIDNKYVTLVSVSNAHHRDRTYKLRTDIEFIFTERKKPAFECVYKATPDGVGKFIVHSIGKLEARVERASKLGIAYGYESRITAEVFEKGQAGNWFVVKEDAIQKHIKICESIIYGCRNKIIRNEKKIIKAKATLSAKSSET